jgi:4-oxalocrotonate tautomerase
LTPVRPQLHFPYRVDSVPELADRPRFCDLPVSGCEAKSPKESLMPLIDIQLIEGVFTQEQKKTMIEKVTEVMVAIEGEAMRHVTWVRIQETGSGECQGDGSRALRDGAWPRATAARHIRIRQHFHGPGCCVGRPIFHF